LALIKEKLVASNGKDNLMLCCDFSYRRWHHFTFSQGSGLDK